MKIALALGATGFMVGCINLFFAWSNEGNSDRAVGYAILCFLVTLGCLLTILWMWALTP